jgi:uncharacterized protein
VILPDLNLLLHAYNAGSSDHEAARQWWEACMNGHEPVRLPWAVVTGFIRVTTHPRVFSAPLRVDEACTIISQWFERPQVRIIDPTSDHLPWLCKTLQHLGTAGNLTTDAHLAVLAQEHGCVLYSADTDFARFPSLSWRNPLAR